jgi:hypothetical protein
MPNVENDDHLYGYFIGKVTPSNVPDPAGFKSILFDGIETKHYDNALNNDYLISDNQNKNVYKVFIGNVLQFVTRINEKIPNSNTPAENNNISEESFLELVKRGDYGCIPKFEANQAGHIAYSDITNGIYTVPLIVAEHNPSDPPRIISNFQFRNFRMTTTDYIRLNGFFDTNKYLEGGLEEIAGSTKLLLKVYDGATKKDEYTEY